MNLSTEHKALFSLLRAGLWEREPDDLSPFPLTDAQWWEVYRMSVRQTVAGIVFRGLHHLPEEYLPADALMIHWVAKADRIERKNRRMDAALRLLLQRMGREGLHPVLLKGQGVAALYEHPLLRECGDIDLCFPSEKEEREAAELARVPDAGRRGALTGASATAGREWRWSTIPGCSTFITRCCGATSPRWSGDTGSRTSARKTGRHSPCRRPCLTCCCSTPTC